MVVIYFIIMGQDRIHLVNKIFNNETIRTVWDEEDEKYYISVVDIEGMFRIIESVSSKNAEPIKQWLTKLGSERIDEAFDPSISVQIAIDLYRTKGYDENTEVARCGGKIAGNARKDLENEIGESVVTSNNALNYEYVNEKEIEMK